MTINLANIVAQKSRIPKKYHADIPTIIELSKSQISKDKEVQSVINQLLQMINAELIVEKVKVVKVAKITAKKTQPKVIIEKVVATIPEKTAKSNSSVLDYPIGQINTDEKRFQNRSKLNDDTVNQIVKNFNPAKFDPIVVWLEPLTNKVFVLAGHHRLEAMKVLKQKTVQVKFLTGTEADAINYAKVESNANRTMEADFERAKVYRKLRMDGKSKKQVLEQARELEGKNANGIINLSFLKENGITIQSLQSLDKADKKNKSTLETIADWIGEAMKMYSEKLDYSHEKEMFDFLQDAETSKRIKSKADFTQKITATVGGFDFDSSNALNLKRLKYSSEGEKVFENEKQEIETKIKSILDKKTELKEKIISLMSSGKSDAEIDDQVLVFEGLTVKANEDIKFYQSKLMELSRNKSKYTNAGTNQAALFGVNKKRVKATYVKKPKLNAPSETFANSPTIGNIKSINDTGKVSSQFFKVNGEIGKFLQAVERKPKESVVITLDGMQGAGKTTMLYKAIDAIAGAGNKSLFISAEEHPESSLAIEKRDKYLSKAAKANTAIVGHVDDLTQLYKYVAPYEFIFVDSWQKLQRMVGAIRLDEDLRKKFDGKVFVVIFQQTTTGRTKGGAEVVFDGDIIIKMVKEASFADNYAYFDKNRYTRIPIENIRYNIAKGKTYNPNAPMQEKEIEPTQSGGFAFQIN